MFAFHVHVTRRLHDSCPNPAISPRASLFEGAMTWKKGAQLLQPTMLSFTDISLVSCLLCLGRVDLGAYAGRCVVGEEAGEEWLHEGAEDNLGAVGLGKGHPENEDKLEDVVEWEPVDCVNGGLNNGQEGVNDPIGEPLCVVGLAAGEESLEGVVGWESETGSVYQELAGDVKEDEEEVKGTDAEDDIDLWDGGLLLELVEDWVLAQLLVELGEVVLGLLLNGALGVS